MYAKKRRNSLKGKWKKFPVLLEYTYYCEGLKKDTNGTERYDLLKATQQKLTFYHGGKKLIYDS